MDSDGKTALMWAYQGGHFEVAITLISSGADINAKDKNSKNALNYSAESGNVGLMKLLLAQCADTGEQKSGVNCLDCFDSAYNKSRNDTFHNSPKIMNPNESKCQNLLKLRFNRITAEISIIFSG